MKLSLERRCAELVTSLTSQFQRVRQATELRLVGQGSRSKMKSGGSRINFLAFTGFGGFMIRHSPTGPTNKILVIWQLHKLAVGKIFSKDKLLRTYMFPRDRASVIKEFVIP